MSNIFAVDGLGLSGSNFNFLGGKTQTLGQRQEGFFVNAANGNLVLQDQGLHLASTRLDNTLNQFYNSEGQLSDASHWRFNTASISGLNGTLNTANSYIDYTAEDGHVLRFSYDADKGCYSAKDERGALSQLRFVNQQWQHISGDHKTIESFDSNGQLTQKADQMGNVIRYRYDGSKLVEIDDSSNGKIILSYDGDLVSGIKSVSVDNTISEIHYGYDANKRLIKTTVLMANDQSYVTEYAYDGDSQRITMIKQSDGSVMQFGYGLVGNEYRISHWIDGQGRQTTLQYDLDAHKTDIIDAHGNNSSIFYDDHQRVIKFVAASSDKLTPVVNEYQYDTHGNLISFIDGNAHKTSYGYDQQGNIISITDANGNTLTRAYDTNNQLVSETKTVAGKALTKRYVYDEHSNLRFIVDETGDVLEYRYDNKGNKISTLQYLANRFDVNTLSANQQLSLEAISTWQQQANLQAVMRQDYQYDALGQLSQTLSYRGLDQAGNGLSNQMFKTQYVYDASGKLMQQISFDGQNNAQITHFTYDALGRLLSKTDALGNTTTTSYDDANQQIRTQFANGLVSLEQYDHSGQIICKTALDQAGQTLGVTHFSYNDQGLLAYVQNPLGQRVYYFYDGQNRQIAEVDATGNVTENVYDKAGNINQKIRYANSVDPSNWLDDKGVWLNKDFSSIKPKQDALDQKAWFIYNADNSLHYQIDGNGGVSELRYDERGLQTEVIHYATPVALSALASNAPLNIQTTAQDRHSFTLYDAAGRVSYQIDALGRATGFAYNNAGAVVAVNHYSQTVAQDALQKAPDNNARLMLMPTATNDDLRSFVLYDQAGQKQAEIDSAGYLTEYHYGQDGLLVSKTRFGNKIAQMPAFAEVANLQLQALRPQKSAHDQTVTYAYDAKGNLIQSVDAYGTISRFSYDAMGNLTQSEVGHFVGEQANDYADVRTIQNKYDLQGHLIARLDANAVALLTQAKSQQEIDSIWQTKSTRFSYDAIGNKIIETDPLGHVSYFYYDQNGRLSYSVDGSGGVTSIHYDSFGQVTEKIRYAQAVDHNALNPNEVSSLEKQLKTTAQDIHLKYQYDSRGNLTEVIDGLHHITHKVYDAFADVVEQSQDVGVANTQTNPEQRIDRFEYDAMGQLLKTTQDVGGLNAIKTQSYDAFGRLIKQTDAAGLSIEHQYDALGREITLTRADGTTNRISYDAFGRKLTQEDALGNITTISYDDQTHSMTATSSEGVHVTTAFDRHGQKITLTDGNGVSTHYQYDKNGNLITTIDGENGVTHARFDANNQLIETVDADNNKVIYQYDALGRLLTKTIDPEGLKITTSMQYDALGNKVLSTDGNGVKTHFEYDQNGNLTKMIEDADGLAVISSFSYDAQGNKVLVTKGGITKAYTYDHLGRLSSEITDPTGLKITKTYHYDQSNQLISATDANGNTTSYRYDAMGRLRFTINALGQVSELRYDQNGQKIAEVQYSKTIDTATLSGLDSLDKLATALNGDTAANINHYVYGKAGELLYEINPQNALTAYHYDYNGNVTIKTQYATAITLPQVLTRESIESALKVDSAHDQTTQFIYNNVNQVRYQINSLKQVTQFDYDGSGKVIKKTEFAKPISQDLVRSNKITLRWAAGQTPMPANGKIEFVYDWQHRSKMAAKVTYHNGFYEVSLPSLTQDQSDFTVNCYDAGGNLVAFWNGTFIPTADSGTQLKLETHHKEQVDGQWVDVALPLDMLFDRSNSVVDMQGFLKQLDSTDQDNHELRNVYDHAGRLSYTLEKQDAFNAKVTSLSYDNDGNLIKKTNVKQTVSPNIAESYQQVIRWPVSTYPDLKGSTKLKIWRADGLIAPVEVPVTIVDGFYQATIDQAQGGDYYLDIDHYDAGGNAKVGTTARFHVGPTQSAQSTTFYYVHKVGDHYERASVAIVMEMTAIPQTTLSEMLSQAVNKTADSNESITYEYDHLGRKITACDGNGFAEHFAYDPNGNVITHTQKNGYQWHYSYDGAGRMLSKQGDALAVATTTLVNGKLVLSQATQAPITRYQYDAMGNVIAITEHCDTDKAHTTSYSYDALNRQVKTTQQGVAVFDVQSNTSTLTNLSNTVIYDTLGRAIVNIDEQGNRTYKVYDQLNQLRFEINAKGYVKEYSYDHFGNKVQTTAYATAVDMTDHPNGINEAELKAKIQESKLDRTISNQYDQGNRLVRAEQDHVFSYQNQTANADSSNITLYDYDSFGNVVRTSSLIDSTNQRWAEHYFYYDALNQQVAEVDSQGYLTYKSYDQFGNVSRQIEFATPLEQGAWNKGFYSFPNDSDDDRTIEYHYDHNHQLVSKTELAVDYQAIDEAHYQLVNKTADLTTSMQYDAMGNVIKTTNALGVSQRMMYDQQGHLIAKTGGFVEGSDLSKTPVTAFEYDIAGNLVASTRLNSGVSALTDTGFGFAMSANDISTTAQYDAWGRMILQSDGNGNLSYFSYNHQNKLAQKKQTVHDSLGNAREMIESYAYDVLAQQTETILTEVDGHKRSESVQYDAFSQVITRSVNGQIYEHNDYDNKGQLWRTNQKDGIAKVYLYDLQGRLSAQVTSQSQKLLSDEFSSANDIATIIHNNMLVTSYFYDGAGNPIRITLPTFTKNGTSYTPEIKQSFNRWGELLTKTDVLGNTTTYRYNKHGQLLQTTLPKIAVMDEAGNAQMMAPVLIKGYDAMGREIAEIDGNGHMQTKAYDAEDRVTQTRDALRNSTSYSYDQLGRKVAAVDALGQKTSFSYDGNDQLVAEDNGFAVNHYAYNELGDRISATNALGFSTRYDYDNEHHLIKQTLAGGQTSTYQYDDRGNKIKEINANNDSMSWQYDVQNRLVAHTDLGGNSFTYRYNELNQLQLKTNNLNQVQTYDYYDNGLLKSIDDGIVGNKDYFEYDLAGNKTLTHSTGYDGKVDQTTTVSYDALGRVTDISGNDLAKSDNSYHGHYDYDAVGNRRHTTWSFNDKSYSAQDNYYLYDADDRMIISGGEIKDGKIKLAADGKSVEILYDQVGKRIGVNYYTEDTLFKIESNIGGKVRLERPILSGDRYQYDQNGNLTLSTHYNYIDHADSAYVTQLRELDKLGQVLTLKSYSDKDKLSNQQVTSYNQNGWVVKQDNYKADGSLSNTVYYDAAGDYDGVGNLTHYRVHVAEGTPYDINYTKTYYKFDSYKQAKISGKNDSGVLEAGSTTFDYDGNGFLKAVSDEKDHNNDRTFYNNTEGMVLEKHQADRVQRYYYVNGKPVGTSGNVDNINPEHKDDKTPSADFDYNYVKVSDGYPAKAPTSYVVQTGDTLQSIAATVFGDSKLWYVIADANNITSNDDLKAKVGQTLTIPNKIDNIHNSSETFRPQDLAKVIGDTNPTMPVIPPPPASADGGGGCGVVGAIITAVVAVVAAVVTVYSLGTLSAPMVAAVGATATAMGVGAAAGAAGYMAGYLAGQAFDAAFDTNIGYGFSWKSLLTQSLVSAATAGVSAGVTGGVNVAASSLYQSALIGGLSDVASQGVQIAANRQHGFNWRETLIATGLAAASYQSQVKLRTDRLTENDDLFIRTGSRVVQTEVNAYANVGLRKAIGDDIAFNMGSIARDAFGNGLGNSIGSDIKAHWLSGQTTEDRGQRTDSVLSSSGMTRGSSNAAKGGYFGSVGKDVFDQMANDSLSGLDADMSDDGLFDAMLHSTSNIQNSESTADDIVNSLVGDYMGRALDPDSYHSTSNIHNSSLNAVDDHYFERNGVMQSNVPTPEKPLVDVWEEGMNLAMAVGGAYDVARLGVAVAKDPVAAWGALKLGASTVADGFKTFGNKVASLFVSENKATKSTLYLDEDISKLAKSWQGKAPYLGVDNYKNITIKKGTEVYGGIPGQSNYYFTSNTLRRFGSSPDKLWQSLQVKSHETLGYRPNIAKYVFTEDTNAAIGITRANPQFGSGGGTQIFIKEFESNLSKVQDIELLKGELNG
ncbi:LysM peptidoglycan-binding domain-containing protein [Cysteiniphilum sp. QT6929]|uniref:LysM peptidoglycan-binding domain-containing protein n=1 Tax=Cysteiniphilum sp. QT6929 TaxID=2975055 RepID=UPI0024B38427|nr:LysM peptidoglycan-binding domain-containing protein [Cysteiniphilum sp. QT6929]WHN66080.1 LysM peptidoglycan-binding domain-containing protein [Cysteiniphilum sp. QT6929]